MGGASMMNGWDYNSMQNWAGISQSDDYFDVDFAEDPSQMGFDLDLPTANSTDMMTGQYGQMDHRHSL
jgi:hypothetical protein